MRVRFAPSPTGALHIGGVRTALYNYLLAKKLGGTFILRIEDTDQARYVPGAEQYITDALSWLGLAPDESPQTGGPFGPYRQSERKALYGRYAKQLVDQGHAYYAFDTSEELDTKRAAEKEKGNHNFKYDHAARSFMRNSLSLEPAAVSELLDAGVPYTIRLKVPDEEIVVQDVIRGRVSFQGKELDDKILMKADGMPTYHMANIVDDHLMEITHVIRGEEWLPSTAHHVLLYKFLGWENSMPAFAHLPLILKPNGKGKLSKRDGQKLGIPVFPLAWDGETPEESFTGFREFGFDPSAVLNFLAFLGWNPGTEQEIFTLEGLIQAFSIEKIGKSGARFDFDKAKWYNQQYIIAASNKALAQQIKPLLQEKGWSGDDDNLETFCALFKERVTFFGDFLEQGYYFFTDIITFEEKMIRKKWKDDTIGHFKEITAIVASLSPFTSEQLEDTVKAYITKHELKFGNIMPPLRIALTGTTKGPDLFQTMALLGSERVNERLHAAPGIFDQMLQSE